MWFLCRDAYHRRGPLLIAPTSEGMPLFFGLLSCPNVATRQPRYFLLSQGSISAVKHVKTDTLPGYELRVEVRIGPLRLASRLCPLKYPFPIHDHRCTIHGRQPLVVVRAPYHIIQSHPRAEKRGLAGM